MKKQHEILNFNWLDDTLFDKWMVNISFDEQLEEAENDDGQAFRGNGNLTPEQEEIRELKAQVKRLEMEREILKKATVFFAKETK